MVIGLSGLAGMERLSGFSDLVQLFFAAMTGWAHTLSNWVWSMISGARQGGGSWLAANWARLLVALVVAGLLLDWITWLLRWQPYKLWFRPLRRRRSRAALSSAIDPDEVQLADAPDMLAESALEALPIDNDYGASIVPIQPVESGAEMDQPLDGETPMDDYYAPASVESVAGFVQEPVYESVESVESIESVPESGYESIYESIPEPDYDPIYDSALEADYIENPDFIRIDPTESIRMELTVEPTVDAVGPRWPWSRRRGESLRTITGKPAQRRGLFRLAGDDDEAIPGLPPMIPHDEGYRNPALPTDSGVPGVSGTGVEL